MATYKLTQKTDANGTTQDIKLDASSVDLSGCVDKTSAQTISGAKTFSSELTAKDITLYAASGNSPRLTFQRGTLSDTFNDWSIFDTSGYLTIQQRGNGSSSWESRATFTQSGATFVGDLEGGTIKKTNGTSSQFLKADGSVDSNTYALSSAIPTKTSELNNDSGFITNAVTSLDGNTGAVTLKTINNNSIIGSGNITISSGQATDVKINGTSITSSNVADIKTNGTYNATSNKIATMSDIPTVPTNVSSFTNDSGYITSSSLSGYVDLTSAQSISGVKTFTNGISVSGRSAGGGDDEGIVVGRASNNYAGVCLGSPSGMRSVFYLTATNQPVWRWNNGSSSYDIQHPAKAGTIALTSDIPDTSSFALASDHPIKLKLIGSWTSQIMISNISGLSTTKKYVLVPYESSSSYAGMLFATGGSTSNNAAASFPLFVRYISGSNNAYAKGFKCYSFKGANVGSNSTTIEIGYMTYVSLYEIVE